MFTSDEILQALKELCTKFSLFRVIGKQVLLYKELVAYWHLEWRVMSHALSVCCYCVSQCLCFGIQDSRVFMLVQVKPLPSKPLAFSPFIKHHSEGGLAEHMFIFNPDPANITDEREGWHHKLFNNHINALMLFCDWDCRALKKQTTRRFCTWCNITSSTSRCWDGWANANR